MAKLTPEQQAEAVEYFYQLKKAQREAAKRIQQEENPIKPIKILTPLELLQEPRLDFLISNWLPEQCLMQVVGEPGTFKSFLTLHAALAIASGDEFFFGHKVVRHGPTMFIAAEGAGGLQYRMNAWCQYHSIDLTKLPFFSIVSPIDIRNTDHQGMVTAAIEEHKPLFVVIDTLSRSVPGADENSAKDMGEAISFCTKSQKIAGSSFALVHHPTKSDPTGGGRGSSVMFGGVDMEWRTKSISDNGIKAISLTCSKNKEGPMPKPMSLVAESVPIKDLQNRELCYHDGSRITSLVLRPPQEGELEEVDKMLESKILTLIVEGGGKTAKEIQAQLGGKHEIIDEVLQRLIALQKIMLVEKNTGRGRPKKVYDTFKHNHDLEFEGDM